MGLINSAIAATTTAVPVANTAANASQNSSIFLMLGFLALFYFLMIRPQYKRAKEHRQLLGGLAEGDEVITSSGMFGKIQSVSDDKVRLLIAKDIEIDLQKSAVTHLIPKGSVKI